MRSGIATALSAALLCCLYGTAAAQFRVRPYVQNPAHDGMTVLWFADAEDPGTIELREDGKLFEERQSLSVRAVELAYRELEVPLLPAGDPGAPWKHEVRFASLKPGTRYDYTVRQSGATAEGHFITAPAGDAPLRFAAYADSETEPESTGSNVDWDDPASSSARPYLVDQTTGYRENLRIIRDRDAAFTLIAGDLAESGGEQRDWDEFWIHNTADYASATSRPIIPVLGNHEYFAGPGGLGGYTQPHSEGAVSRWRAYFDVPKNNAADEAQRERYYRMDYGPITLIVLDVCNGRPASTALDTNWHLLGAGDAAGGKAPDFNVGTAQHTWLVQQLADAQLRSRFTFVSFHHVPYSVGPHGRSASTDQQSGVPVRSLTPDFIAYGVDAVFCGHDEMYERSTVTGIENRPGGIPGGHTVHFYDIGIGGDGLRGPYGSLTNAQQAFLAHTHAPEVWADGILVSGGKHYGHLEVSVAQNEAGLWQAVLAPAHSFPLMEMQEGSTVVKGFERRVYDDIVTLNAFQPTATVDLALSLSVDNEAPSPGDTVMFTATITNPGATRSSGVTMRIELPDGIAALAANAPTRSTWYPTERLWYVGQVPPGVSVSLTLQARIESARGPAVKGPIVATVQADQSDSAPANNSASVVFSAPLGDSWNVR